ncbi:MAG TPA: VOC family protein [Rhodocyclaceae bacterium]|uniref:VOC family protein n=1 Tax=Accumulibacter sp. TaxID=2053492 RepID=UPI0025D4B509|nr:VOC family protein [Accumulibacter sp.]MCM8597990.1 VOC family protein [Accumulibacter sp.]HMW77081.1 VOC family protein [Rhodocyclaceae bacterium]
MSLNAYLFFDGNCEEAIAFYERSVGAQRDALMRYEENPAAGCPGMHANFGGKIMHAKLRIGGDELLLADDCMGHPVFQGFSLTLAVADEAEARQRFDALAAGGKITMPLGPTFFSQCFGMLQDPFGVNWMVIVPAPMP